MDTYMYGLLGLSLAANALTAISSIVASSKRRDEENERSLSLVHQDVLDLVTTVERELNERITHEVSAVLKEVEDNDTYYQSQFDRLEEVVYSNQTYDIGVVSSKTKKRN